MKKVLFVMCLVVITITALAGTKNETQNPIVGTWKFSSQSAINDFQKVFNNKNDYKTEFFMFESDKTFKHDFVNKSGNLVKTMKGKWKLVGNKINIVYSDIEYSMTLEYFYIGKDLILGQNFNHVVFTKENADFQNMAAK
jgi:hypothetical protein